MSNILPIPFNGGYVSTGTGARDASDLGTGELQEMTGGYYRKNDPNQVWNMPGRSLFGVAGSGAVKGLAICQFDEGGTDKLVASIGTTLVAATPGATGTFASLATSFDASATKLTACQQDDRWFLGNGYDANKCLKSDGTVRAMGMAGPQVALTVAAASSTGTIARPTEDTGGFVNPTYAYDSASIATYSSGTLSAVGSVTHTWKTWASNTDASRSLYYYFSLSGQPIDSDVRDGGTVGTGGTVDAGYDVTVLIEKSENSGVTWETLFAANNRTSAFTTKVNSVSISNATNSSAVHFRATLTYNTGVNKATLRVYDIQIYSGSTASNFNTTGSMYYTYTEYDSLDDNEGPPVQTAELAAFTGKNYVTVTRAAAVNPAATHWRLYRTVPGAANTIDNLGFVQQYLISETVVNDVFVLAADTIGSPVIPALTVGDLSIPRDAPPPSFLCMISWNGAICGFSRTNRRAFRYSMPGRPESFPEFYVVSSFPLDEHDGLVGLMAVGETMVLLASGAVLALDDLPTVVDGQFNGANARPIKGHPGCVGEYAYSTFSVAGEPRGAWVSPFGVYITNGQTCACISTDLAWENEVNVSHLSTAVLRWDAKNLILWFEFDLDGDGLNDHEMPFHMAEAHSKGEARPKLGQPTAKATSCMASALIDSTHYRFSGHPTNGSVYVEESGSVDVSTGATVAMTVRSAQVSHDKVDLGVIKATLNHSDFGTGETGTFTATLYRDSANTENSRSQSIRLDGNRGTTIGIGRAGELVDVEVSYSGSGSGGVGGVDLEIEGHGRSGSAPRVTSSSATP